MIQRNKLKDLESFFNTSRILNKRLRLTSNHLFDYQLDLIIENDFVKKFYSYFEDKKSKHSHLTFLEAVEFLIRSCGEAEESLKNSKLKQQFYNKLEIQILSKRPHYLEDYLNATYSKAFKVFAYLKKKSNPSETIEDDEDEDEYEEENKEEEMGETEDTNELIDNICLGCGVGDENCQCDSIYARFLKVNQYLRDLNLLENLISDTVMSVARHFIEKKVSAKCKSDYSCSYVEELTSWAHEYVDRYIQLIYDSDLAYQEMIDSRKLDQFLKDAYAEVRVSHMFEIILEYPNSEAAIQDLKMCLDETTSSDFRLNLVESVKRTLVESLLHPGVNTFDILTAYISAIKALRALDPTGLILQLVTEPVRQYLKSRGDTVRCIVTALTDEDHTSELNREMIKSSSQTNENGQDGKSGIETNLPNEGERCTTSNFEKWKPDPIKLNLTDDSTKSNRFSDIVSILVNIYETKDLFVEEYQKLLSKRLLEKYDNCNLDAELRNLELLTIRFSDCELHRCEVMLKDVQTSKRINKRILSGDIREHKLTDFNNLDVLIVSSPFWPEKFGPMSSINEDESPEIEFPPDIQEAIGTYTKAFESIQASRTLHWRHHLGSINLDLTIDGKTHNFTVSPLHAALIYLFREKKSWRLSELMHKTSLPAATLKSKLVLWQNNGVIDSSEDKYDLKTAASS